jgi:hypothetical protein
MGLTGVFEPGRRNWSSSLPVGTVRKSVSSSSKEPFRKPHHAVTNTSPFGGRQVGGRVDWHAEDHEQTMLALGLSSKREITRTRIRVRTAMAAQTREQGPLPGRPAAVRVPARRCGAAPAPD